MSHHLKRRQADRWFRHWTYTAARRLKTDVATFRAAARRVRRGDQAQKPGLGSRRKVQPC